MMTRFTFVATVLVVLVVAAQTRAEELDALPGLWKTTLRIVHAGNNEPPQVRWHCVIEKADPWIAFARLPVLPHESCQRKGFVRTSTSLQWQLVCTGDFEITNAGSIIFDSAQHYHGTVRITGSLMGYPIADEIRLEGEHKAACTSPQD